MQTLFARKDDMLHNKLCCTEDLEDHNMSSEKNAEGQQKSMGIFLVI